MENRKKRPWWAFVILFCLCGVSHLAREFGGGVMLPPTSFFGIWHLFVLPVLGTVVLVAANRLGGKYDFVLLLAFELLTLAWMFVPEIIRAGGFFTPFELPIWFVVTVVSIPAIAAFILRGITYFITKMAARKKNAKKRSAPVRRGNDTAHKYDISFTDFPVKLIFCCLHHVGS